MPNLKIGSLIKFSKKADFYNPETFGCLDFVNKKQRFAIVFNYEKLRTPFSRIIYSRLDIFYDGKAYFYLPNPGIDWFEVIL